MKANAGEDDGVVPAGDTPVASAAEATAAGLVVADEVGQGTVLVDVLVVEPGFELVVVEPGVEVVVVESAVELVAIS